LNGSNPDVKSTEVQQEETKLNQPTIKEPEAMINPDALIPGANPFAKREQKEKISAAVAQEIQFDHSNYS
jgi:hypothetical protein